ncbi:hypothetical protein T069G_03813 [Trichoderma breve]|uniref:Uncharacterized protein n=1 Tax=Trichoderma breve TaxID=2034170 RepID=A0A9W9BIH6_9HYPO|nr:hypothetical protein T069G_03813 [Trichoderma breve]KAJ4862859.1 hypothetical protein T069G_03813 [Trichoderma breve]
MDVRQFFDETLRLLGVEGGAAASGSGGGGGPERDGGCRGGGKGGRRRSKPKKKKEGGEGGKEQKKRKEEGGGRIKLRGGVYKVPAGYRGGRGAGGTLSREQLRGVLALGLVPEEKKEEEEEEEVTNLYQGLC